MTFVIAGVPLFAALGFWGHDLSRSHTKLALHKSRIVAKMREGLLFGVLRPPLFL